MPTFTTKDGRRVSFKAKGEKAPRRRRSGGSMGKKTGRRRGRRSGGRRSYYHRMAGRAKGIFDGILGGGTIPLTGSYLLGGTIAEIFNLAPDKRAKFFAGLQSTIQSMGLNYPVNGYTVGGVLIAAKAVAAFWPWFGTKINAFLAGFKMHL